MSLATCTCRRAHLSLRVAVDRPGLQNLQHCVQKIVASLLAVCDWFPPTVTVLASEGVSCSTSTSQITRQAPQRFRDQARCGLCCCDVLSQLCFQSFPGLCGSTGQPNAGQLDAVHVLSLKCQVLFHLQSPEVERVLSLENSLVSVAELCTIASNCCSICCDSLPLRSEEKWNLPLGFLGAARAMPWQ